MGQYRVNGVQPWYWKSHNFKVHVPMLIKDKLRAEIREAYMKMLTTEERALGAYIK